MKTIGVIGLAGMGLRRLECLASIGSARADHLCTLNEALLAERANQFGVDKTTTDWRALLADELLDAVCICTPNNLHAEIAEAAMLAGKDVLLEYPMAVSLEQVDRLVAVAEQTGRVLHVGTTTRHEPQHLAVRERLGQLGELVAVRGAMAMPEVCKWYGRPEAFGSFFALANFHFADQVADWFGPPAWVSGSLWQRQAGPELSATSASMFFGYDGGASGHISYTMGLPAQRDFLRFELIGTDSRFTWRDRVLTHHRPDGSAEELLLVDTDPSLRDTEQFIRELLGEQPPCPPAEAAVTTRLCLLAEQSARSGHVAMPV